MNFRYANTMDLPRISEIIKQGQEYLKSQNIYQWVNGYPDIMVLTDDIRKKHAYVLEDKGKTVAYMALCLGQEETYKNIYDGAWLADMEYGTIHRIAVENGYKGKGLAAQLFSHAEKICLDINIRSLRIDTHEQNISMQRAIKKFGFTYCGIIHLKDGNPRIAFEKLLDLKESL